MTNPLPTQGVEALVEALTDVTRDWDGSDLPDASEARTPVSCFFFRQAAQALTNLQAENEGARALLMTRYVSGNVLRMIEAALKDLKDNIETVCRLRGETDFDADLKRFVQRLDHPGHYPMSPSEISEIIDFAQGQKAVATTLRERIKTLEGALGRLERANDAVAATRSQATYDRISLDPGAREAMYALDEARRLARQTLSALQGGDHAG